MSLITNARRIVHGGKIVSHSIYTCTGWKIHSGGVRVGMSSYIPDIRTAVPYHVDLR